MNIRMIMLVLLAAVFYGCPTVAPPTNADEEAVVEGNYDVIFLADSLLSEAQLELKYKIAEMSIFGVSVKDGIVVADVSEKDFKDNGIPVYYYEMMLKDIEVLNGAMKEDGLTVEEMEEWITTAKEEFSLVLQGKEIEALMKDLTSQ